MKNIDKIPQQPMDGNQAALHLFGAENSQNARLAYSEMKKAGWTFYGYSLHGTEIWQPPGEKKNEVDSN